MTDRNELLSEVKEVSESISINHTNMVRFEKYLKLIAKKFKLGAYIGTSDNSKMQMYTFGKVAFTCASSGMYVHLGLLYSSVKGKNGGSEISHYHVSSDPKPPKAGSAWVKAPSHFKKAEQIVGLALFAGNEKVKQGTGEANEGKQQVVIRTKSVTERFEILSSFLSMLVNKNNKAVRSLIVHGTGGTGKTFTLLKIVKEMGYLQDRDYFVLGGGKVTATTFYKFLYENQDELVIIDDLDSPLQDETMTNFIKGALDSTPPNTVTYDSPAIEAMGLPTSFEFTGKMIFLTNLPLSVIAQPVLSRAKPVNVTMTRDEIMELAEHLMSTDKLVPEVPKEVRDACWEFTKEVYEESDGQIPVEFSLRSVGGLLEAAGEFAKMGMNWEDEVYSLMYSGFDAG